MDNEKLIEKVSNYEFLYNLKHPKYMDSVKKEMAWKEISQQLNQPADACKQKWQSLRDGYRRALNKRKSKSGQAVQNFKKWKYEDEMSFVSPFFSNKKLSDFVKHDSSNSDNEIEETEYQNDESTMLDKFEQQISHSKTTMFSLPVDHHDELDRFFFSVSETVKKFSPYLQAVAKNKIFTLVSEMELQQLAPSELPTSSQFSCIDTASESISTYITPVPSSPNN